MIKIMPVILLLILPWSLCAQDNDREDLATDRPTRAQAPTVVPKGTLQIESGLELQQDKKDTENQTQYLYPTTLLRLGIFKNAELRLEADYKKESTRFIGNGAAGTTEEERGFSDVRVGAKVKIYEGIGMVPQIGILGNITLSTGNEQFRPPQVAPEGRLLFSNKFSEKFELEYNAGYRKKKEQDEYRGEALYAVTGTLKLTDQLTYFAEVFGQKPQGQAAAHSVDAGLMFKLLPNLQLDVIGALGLNQAAPDYLVGGGLTWRVPR